MVTDMARTTSARRANPPAKPKAPPRATKRPASKPRPGSRSRTAKAKPVAPRRRWGRLAAKWILVSTIWLAVGVGGLVAWYAADLPEIDGALTVERRPVVTLLSADGSELAQRGELRGVPVSVGELPPALPHAVLAVEDRRFYGHFGVDILGLARAAYANLRAGAVVQGGSTITQQAAKNLFFTPDRTLKRKVQELLLAFWLERRFTKDQILGIYLNRVYLGAGTYGVDAAARRYFGRPAAEVTTYQAAMLAGLLKAPSRYNPVTNPDAAAARTRMVLRSMVAAGYLTTAQAGAAEADRGAILAAVDRRLRGRHFADWTIGQVEDFAAGGRDVVVMTTLDPRLQRLAEEAVAWAMTEVGPNAGAGEAALVAMSPDGAVRAMVGGRDYAQSQFNRAVQARRQPGSAFKPVVYLAALEAGLTPDSLVTDGPITVGSWRPGNFDRTYRGPVTLRQALAESLNTAAVRLVQEAGPPRVVEAARRLGITAPLDPHPSLALGTGEVSLIELTAAYAVFASGGLGVWPYGIETVRDAEGELLYARAGSGPGPVVAAEDAAAITRMLAAAVTTGTGRAADFGRPAAGKTGTSQNFRDAWFVGYSADVVVGVWIGNDDGRAMHGVTGGGLPAQVWRRFMAGAHDGAPVHSLPGLQPPASSEPDGPGFFERLLDLFRDEA